MDTRNTYESTFARNTRFVRRSMPARTTQMKQEAMYVLRKSIRAFETVEEGHAAVKEKLDTYPKSLVGEALLARDQNRGMSLLSFAAQQGNEVWFLDLLRRIRQEVCLSQVRESSPRQSRHTLACDSSNSRISQCLVSKAPIFESRRSKQRPSNHTWGLAQCVLVGP